MFSVKGLRFLGFGVKSFFRVWVQVLEFRVYDLWFMV
jgi:hypothetical protein